MEQEKLFIPTQKTIIGLSGDSLADSLIKGGYIRKMSNGEYAYLPLANRILQKLEAILRKQLQKNDANELRFSVTNELPEIVEYQLTDAHRQLITDLTSTDLAVIQFLSREIQSYRQLPLTFFQIQTIKIDEYKQARTLLNESHALFVDGYFMHIDESSLDIMYQRLLDSFADFFKSCQLEYRCVVDDVGLACRQSRVFIGQTDLGKEELVVASKGSYAALKSIAKSCEAIRKTHETFNPLSKITEDERQAILDKNVPRLNYNFFRVKDQLICVFYLAEDSISFPKLKHFFHTNEIVQLKIDEVKDELGEVKSIEDLLAVVKVIADAKTQQYANYYLDFSSIWPLIYYPLNLPTDLKISEYTDVRYVKLGEPAPENQGELIGVRGNRLAQIEMYPLVATNEVLSRVTNDENEQIPVYLGHYAMNISEIFALIAQQCQQENKFIWPATIAPYDVHLLQMNSEDKNQSQLLSEIYQLLQPKQYDILVDQRIERVGVKFAEADLIGCPIRIIVGKKAVEGVVELFLTNQNVQVEVRKDDLLSTLAILLGEM